MHAVTCLSQCLLKDEVAHLLVQPRGHRPHLFFTAPRHINTHKLYHMLEADTHLTPLLLTLSVTLHQSNPFPVLSTFSWVSVSCVCRLLYLKLFTVSLTLTAQCPTCTAPLLPHTGKVCLSTFHLMPRSKCLSSS